MPCPLVILVNVARYPANSTSGTCAWMSFPSGASSNPVIVPRRWLRSPTTEPMKSSGVRTCTNSTGSRSRPSRMYLIRGLLHTSGPKKVCRIVSSAKSKSGSQTQLRTKPSADALAAIRPEPSNSDTSSPANVETRDASFGRTVTSRGFAASMLGRPSVRGEMRVRATLAERHFRLRGYAAQSPSQPLQFGEVLQQYPSNVLSGRSFVKAFDLRSRGVLPSLHFCGTLDQVCLPSSYARRNALLPNSPKIGEEDIQFRRVLKQRFALDSRDTKKGRSQAIHESGPKHPFLEIPAETTIEMRQSHSGPYLRLFVGVVHVK